MYVRQLSAALDHEDVRNLSAATCFAEKRGKPLTMMVTIHPALLADYPSDLGQWVCALTNKLRIWCERVGFGYFAIWVRENYVGERKEHLHVLLYVPDRERAALEAAMRRWLPGVETVVHFTKATFRNNRSGRRVNKALTYMLKQMSTQAWYALGRPFNYPHFREG